MRKRSSKRTALLAIALLLIGIPCVVCLVWVRKEQRQYALNRQLIEALKKGDSKQTIALVEAGADPNTRSTPPPAPSLAELMNQLLHRSSSLAKDSPTALMLACGATWMDEKGSSFCIWWSDGESLPVIKAMLAHGVQVNAKEANGMTALYWLLGKTPRKAMIKQLLVYGADPDSADRYGGTPIKQAEHRKQTDLVALLRKYRK